MKSKYRELTGTDPDKASDIGIRMAVLAGEIFSAQAEMNFLKNQMFPSTASGEYLDLHAEQRGLARKPGTKAVAEVDFYLTSLRNRDVEIPQGTILAVSADTFLRFSTDHDVTITAGHLSGHATVTALEAGAKGNVTPMSINIIVTPQSVSMRVQNDFAAEHGTDEESDDALRKRIIDSYVNIPNGTNRAYYAAEALSVDGVSSVGVIPKQRGAGTVDVYVASADGTASEDLISAVSDKLQQAREVNVDVTVHALTIIPVDIYMRIAVKDGYEFSDVSSCCESAFREWFSTLSGGQSVYLSDIGEVAAHVDGVKNYTFITQRMGDVELPASSAARCGNVTITERS
ncbi:MAG: baseplate J/gp47 family protein [Clostridia bacterium]|nr:baseplate J/gp47 family protein [Clostridia bacterium]